MFALCKNTGNTCYVNATLQSLVAVLGEDDTSAELEPLLHHCSNHNQEQRPLNPTGLFSLPLADATLEI